MYIWKKSLWGCYKTVKNVTNPVVMVLLQEFHKLSETRKLYQAEMDLRERKGGKRLGRGHGSTEQISGSHADHIL